MVNTEIRLIISFAAKDGEGLYSQLYDEAKCKDTEVTIAVQVNGKMRGTVMMDADLDNDTVIANVLANEKIAAFLAKQEGQIRKTIVVKNKLVNLIVK